MIRNQTRQVTELVDQILLFASSREGKLPYIARPLHVSQIVEAAVANTAELARDAGFVLDCHVQDGLPCVLGELSALSRCLQNLVVNAVKYGGTDRWIGIRAIEARPSERSAPEVQISVLDHGIGIDQSELEQIFEPFYRSPVVSAAQIHGTGLGLPLAKSIAEAMGGNLSVRSELGKGSVFTLHLPAASYGVGQPGKLSS